MPLIILIAVAALLTFYVFKRRALEHGLKKGTAAHPQQVKRENPPDPKPDSVNRQGV